MTNNLTNLWDNLSSSADILVPGGARGRTPPTVRCYGVFQLAPELSFQKPIAWLPVLRIWIVL